MNCADIEIALMQFLDVRRNFIIPNASYGLGLHECDLLLIRKSGYATEIEIKISKADLIQDKKKEHGHRSSKIRELYFAIPTELMPYIEHIPERAGIIEIDLNFSCHYRREAKINCNYKWTEKELIKAGHLCAMRLLKLKEIIRNYTNGNYIK